MKAPRLFAALVLLLLALAPAARAVSDPAEMLPNPAEERRAEALGEQLRCLVCQNESIEQSDADLAKDLRRIIRQRIAAGESDRQIMDWMVARYGNFVRLDPPFDAMTLVLWGAPVLALGGGLGVALLLRRRGPAPPPQPPLTDAERMRLAELTEAGPPAR
ncbi:MAG TPA: cytochrome c-type biogenesis protein [Acetobacteraceae bacterium]|nr:cytochrome c-type biogenesis protein [Acetobacteraceae bacterium]